MIFLKIQNKHLKMKKMIFFGENPKQMAADLKEKAAST